MRTTSSRSAVLVLGAAGALAAAGLVAPAAATTGTYTQPGAVSIGQSTAAAGGAPVTINDSGAATPYPSTASVGGLVGVVTDVNVTLLGFSHTDPDDVDVMLVSPGGKRTIVMSDIGGDTALAGVDITLDDQAAQSLPDAGALATGSYRPGDFETGDPFPAPAPEASGAGAALSVFNDTDPNGTWQLFVADDDALDSGSMTGWRLDVTTTGPQPYPSALTVSGAADTITDVDVILHGLSHTSPGDIDMLLVGPAGQQATILSDAGSDADVSGVTVTIDDEAATPVPAPVVAGTYQPTNAGGTDPFPAPAPPATGTSALSVFDGTNPNGAWRLFVADDAAGDSGSLAGGWSLRISADDTIAPSVASTVPTAGKTRVKRGADITATFTEPVRSRTVNRDTVYLVRARSTVKIRATVRYNASRQRVTLDPRAVLLPDTKYRAFVTTKVKDLAGNRLDQAPTRTGRQLKSWTFRTR